MTTTATRLHAPTSDRRLRLLRVLGVDLYEELVSIVREPAALLFTVAMPVAFFALFTTLWGHQDYGGLPVATTMLATFGTFGVLGVSLFNPGVGVAEDRERGWLRVKRVSASPLPVALAAKALATVPYSLGVLLAMTAAAALSGWLEVGGVATWLRLVAVLVVGGMPFALVGLAVGLVASPRAATALLQLLLLPAAVLSGLWIPLEALPEVLQRVTPVLPPYHLAQLGLAQLGVDTAAPVGLHVAVLAATTAGTALLAAIAYHHARP